jgi:D-alanyl-D-alanine carboxypeptidase
MKKIISFFVGIFIILSFNNFEVKADTSPPTVEAEGVALIDATTGTILYGKNEHKVLAPASTTKIMTALLVLENKKLDDKVTIGKKPPFAEGTSVALKEGEIYTVNDLLHGLLLESANDCAQALAESVAGSEEAFAKLMNNKARELGAFDTHFLNASGLYEEGHVTTAYDLSLIMAEVVKNEAFKKIAREPLYKFPPSNLDGTEKWVNNKNRLINPNDSFFYKYALCGKTGYTTLSKHTYTAAAEKDGHILVLSMLNSQNKNDYFPDAKKLFEYGFNNFSVVKLYSKGEEIYNYKINDTLSVPLETTEDIYYVGKNDEFKNCTTDADKINRLKPTVTTETKDLSKMTFHKGDILLTASIAINGKELYKVPLSSAIDREYKSLTNNTTFSIAGYSALAFLLLIFMAFKFNRNRRKKKLKGEYNKIL